MIFKKFRKQNPEETAPEVQEVAAEAAAEAAEAAVQEAPAAEEAAAEAASEEAVMEEAAEEAAAPEAAQEEAVAVEAAPEETAADEAAPEEAAEATAEEAAPAAAEEAAPEETPQAPKVPLKQKLQEKLAPMQEKIAAWKEAAAARKTERQALREAEKAAKAQAEAMQQAEKESRDQAEAEAKAAQEAPKAEAAPRSDMPKLEFGSQSPKADAAPRAEAASKADAAARNPYGGRRSSDPSAVSIRTEKHIERILVRQVKLHKRITLMSAAGIVLFAITLVLFILLLVQIHGLHTFNAQLLERLDVMQQELTVTEPPVTEPIVVPIPPEFTEPVTEDTEPVPTDEEGNPIETEAQTTPDSPITITKQPTNERISEWSDLSASIFTVTAEGEGLTFQWQKWDKEDSKWNNIQTGSVYLIYNGDGQTALMLAKFSDDVYGKFRCVITNEYGGQVATQYAEILEP